MIFTQPAYEELCALYKSTLIKTEFNLARMTVLPFSLQAYFLTFPLIPLFSFICHPFPICLFSLIRKSLLSIIQNSTMWATNSSLLPYAPPPLPSWRHYSHSERRVGHDFKQSWQMKYHRFSCFYTSKRTRHRPPAPTMGSEGFHFLPNCFSLVSNTIVNLTTQKTSYAKVQITGNVICLVCTQSEKSPRNLLRKMCENGFSSCNLLILRINLAGKNPIENESITETYRDNRIWGQFMQIQAKKCFLLHERGMLGVGWHTAKKKIPANHTGYSALPFSSSTNLQWKTRRVLGRTSL